MTHPPTSTTPDSAHCPACERYVGPAHTCPWCGVDDIKPVSIRVFKWAVMFMAPIGILLLYLMASNQELPLKQISDLSPAMNYGHIRVQGTVTRPPTIRHYEEDVDYVSFTLDDGTGRIRILAYRDTALALSTNGTIPGEGDQVLVGGVLTIRNKKNRSLTMNQAAAIRIHAVENALEDQIQRGDEVTTGGI